MSDSSVSVISLCAHSQQWSAAGGDRHRFLPHFPIDRDRGRKDERGAGALAGDPMRQPKRSDQLALWPSACSLLRTPARNARQVEDQVETGFDQVVDEVGIAEIAGHDLHGRRTCAEKARSVRTILSASG